ncbi:nucleoid-associated protein [Pseudomonas sp. 21LCFQ010]|uniref:nucleoid-associated protein n=1 Tax=Pseudomonas sp. 21LCFQ010 TaxID=2957506 RepID=UPI002097B178|nr:nucleoid-associated protein [Pseudomonas sp. 21LCFQ010]MCO8164822.1 nucleoid-associated protein [Pseudomonas sp. 21LCFQ010]
MFKLSMAIIHSFKKLAHTDYVSEVVKKTKLLDIENPALESLAKGINGLIGKEGNSVVYGQFSNDGRQGPFPQEFEAYTSFVDDNKKFLDLSHLAMDQLVDQAGKQVLSTGGHILFAIYESVGEHFFICASMKQKGGIQLDENYVPIEIQEVDLNKVQQAARINLKRFNEIKQLAPENEDSEADKTYLCFISKGRDSQASDYFISALGCAKGVASGRATKNAIDNVGRFFRDRPALRSLSYKAKEAVTKYLESALEAGTPARLDSICHAAISLVSPELVEEVEGLKDYLNGERNRVPNEFTVNAKALKEKTRIKGEASNWSLQFDKGALGEDPVSDIFYDSTRKKITLSNLSAEMILLIEKELSARTA